MSPRPHILPAAPACGLTLGLACPLPLRAQEKEPISNEYWLTLFPYHRINDEATGFGYLGYVNNPDEEYQTFYPGGDADDGWQNST